MIFYCYINLIISIYNSYDHQNRSEPRVHLKNKFLNKFKEGIIFLLMEVE